ncbi:MAG: amine dehydrogenase [Deltaproteobacteria bacterium]|nr:amine dehydrogenase [Deltaproteobacteria bacterium]
MSRRAGAIVTSCLVLALGPATIARPDVALEAEHIGSVETLPMPPAAHWVWVADPLLERLVLIDLDSGRTLGMIDGGWGIPTVLFSADGREVYVPETHYARRSRGERTDVVTLYDTESLAVRGEVVIPAKRAHNAQPGGNAALSDDGRFAAVFNMNPGTSLSIVDLREQRFAGEIPTPGCSLVYGAGARRFVMICADGALLTVTLDDSGQAVSRVRSEPFFDSIADPVTEKAVRVGDRWLFASFEGMLHAVDVSGDAPRFEKPWSLLSDDDRADEWRVGGTQHLAVHRASGRLYSLVHQGGVDSHKDAGSELWVYDLASKKRVQRIELSNPGITFLGASLEFGQDWVWPFNGTYDALLSLGGAAVSNVTVTQGDDPLLVTSSAFSGALGIYDATTGEFLRRVQTTGNMISSSIHAPWGGTR